MKLIRHTVGELGIYAAVERDCPKEDPRRNNKPDGSWLPRVGMHYSNAISFWKPKGLVQYEKSGLFAWHSAVVKGEVIMQQYEIDQIQIQYQDDFQVIGQLNSK
jgi:hypothetical protein